MRHDMDESGVVPALKLWPGGAGKVWIVGTGPGDPELLTVKAMRLIERARLVLYDNLVSQSILALLPHDAERVYVGKKRSAHTLPQTDINRKLVEYGSAGCEVLRLKGGDPFVFGRGSEEIEALASAGVPFEVVPGITAAVGAAAYAGIPLTDRRYAQSCVLATGQLQDGSIDLDWVALSRPNQTLAVYMGLVGLPVLCRELIAHGKAPDTPVAVIRHGTLPDQKVVTARLDSIVEAVAANQMTPPTLILVGEVVRLHEKLRWFEVHSESPEA